MAIVPDRYASAILDLAIDNGKVDQFESELQLLLDEIITDDVYQIVNYPIYTIEQKIGLIQKITNNNVDVLILNFLIILLKNDRINSFSKIVETYKQLANKYRSIQVIDVVTAYELDSNQIDDIITQAKSIFKTENVQINVTINPEIVGGILLKKGDTVIDGTLKKKIEDMRNFILKNS